MEQEIQQQTISDIILLQASQPNKNYLVHALCLSRTQTPKPEALPILGQLTKLNSKWMEVIRRISEQDKLAFKMVVQTFINDFFMYRSFVEMAIKHKEEIIVNRVISQIIQRMKLNIQIDVNQSILFETLEMLLIHGAYQNINCFTPFYANEPAVYVNYHLDKGSYAQVSVIHLIQKFIQFEKKNAFLSSFVTNYSQFNNLIMNLFNNIISNSNPTPETLNLLSVLTQKPSLYSSYIQHGANLLAIIENNLIAWNKKMNRIFVQQFQQVINYQEDMIKGQQSKTIETQSAKLLISLLSNVDGMFLELFELIIQKLKKVFSEKNLQQNKQTLELLYLQLLMMGKLFEQRTDLQQRLTQFLGDYSQYIFVLNEQTPLLNSRLIKMIQTFIKILPSNLVEQTISFLFRIIEQCKIDGLSLRVYNTLQTFIVDPNLYVMICPCMVQLSSRLLVFIEKAPSHHYFQILGDCLSQYKHLAKRYCTKFLQYFTTRLNIEIKQCNLNQKRINQIIVQIYECIKTIFCISGVLDDEYQEIDSILNQHAAYLENPNQIEFSDKILYLAAIVLKKGKTITPFILNCLKSVNGVYNKNKDFDCLFELFYALCHDATDQLLNQYESIEFMVNLLLKYFKQQLSQSIIFTSQFQKACVLLQLIIQYCQTFFSKGELRNKIMTQLTSCLSNIKSTAPAQFINIFLSLHFISPFDLPLSIQYFQLTTFYNDRLRSLYLISKIKYGYERSLQIFIQFLKIYFDKYLVKITTQNIEIDYQQKYLSGIVFPYQQIDDIIQAQQLWKQLVKQKKIDVFEFTQDQRETLNTLTKVGWCGKQLRKIHKFVHIDK